jgi:hypothetical protein
VTTLWRLVVVLSRIVCLRKQTTLQPLALVVVNLGTLQEPTMHKAFTLADCVFAVAYGVALGLLIAAFI